MFPAPDESPRTTAGPAAANGAAPRVRELAPEGIASALAARFLRPVPHLARAVTRAVHRDGALSAANVIALAGVGRDRAPLVRESLDFAPSLRLERRVASEADGGARLVLSLDRLGGKEAIEAVTIEHRGGMTLCLSSQAGCALKCAFCATGVLGFRADLTAGEILEQHAWGLRTTGKRPTHAVFMGMGEPFLNYDAVVEAAHRLTLADGAQISPRKIVISTSGIAPAIRRYAREKQPFPLIFSLTSAIPDKRRRLMPVEAAHPLPELLDAIEEYRRARHRNRTVTLAYTTIPGENMGAEDVEALRPIVKTLPCIIDVIPYNTAGGPFRAPSWAEVKEFTLALRTLGVPVKVRYSSGKAVAAGCGQLAADRIPAPPLAGHMAAPAGVFSDLW